MKIQLCVMIYRNVSFLIYGFHFNIYSLTIQIHNVNKISSLELEIWACDFSLGKLIPSRNRCPYFENAQRVPLTQGKDLKSTSALNFNFSLIPKLKNILNNMIQFLIMSSHY